MYAQGNFQNILSLCLNMYDEESGEYKVSTLNFDLTTGDEFAFEDIFSSDANLTNLVKQAFWKNLSVDAYYEESEKYYEQGIYDFDVVASASEEELYELTKKFLSSKDKNFYVDPQGVTFIYNDTWNRIKFKDCYESVVIYNKFDTAFSIFENNDIACHGLINMSERSEYAKNIEYGFVYDNLFVDYCLGTGMFDNFEFENSEDFNNMLSIREIIIEDAQEKIDEYKKLAKNNPDTMYLCFGSYEEMISYHSDYITETDMWKYELGDICSYTFYESFYSMPMSSYAQKGKEDLYDAYQGSYFSSTVKTLYYDGEWIDKELYPLGLEIHNYVYEDCPTRVFSISQIKEYKDFLELVDENSDYLNAVCEEIYTSMNDHWDDTLPKVTYEEAYELAKNAEIKLDSSGIRIYPEIENLDSYWMFISYEDLTEYMIGVEE